MAASAVSGLVKDTASGAQAGGRAAGEILAQARAATGAAHRSAVDALPGLVRHIAGYHIGWWDADGRPCDHGGKMIRPALTLACARAVSGQAEWPEAAVAAAVSVELIHDFSLLHDDVMDKDLTRRGRRTAWAQFGASQAILAGDALLVAAMDLAGGGRAAIVLSQAVLELCAGQSADLAFETRSGVGLGECLTMAEQKTGALLGAACQLGAMAGGADDTAASWYRAFGRELGLAFQLADDLLGIWGDPLVTGKPAGSDLTSRKKSLPVVAARASGTEAGDHLGKLYEQDGEMSPQTAARAARLVEAAGGRAWAQQEAERRTAAALTALARAHPDPGGTADLRALAAVIARRDL